MLHLEKAEYLHDYKIRVQFNDGSSGVVDLEGSLWGPVFEPLKDQGTFKQFTVSPVLHTICWENDADFAPEYLHREMISQQKQ